MLPSIKPASGPVPPPTSKKKLRRGELPAGLLLKVEKGGARVGEPRRRRGGGVTAVDENSGVLPFTSASLAPAGSEKTHKLS